MVDIKLLEFQEGFFDEVWTVISSQEFSTLILDCYQVVKSILFQNSWLKIRPAGVRS